MRFDHFDVVGLLFKVLMASLGLFKKEKALPMPVAAPSQALARNFDSRDFAIICLGVIAIVSTVALVSLALKKPVVLLA